MRLFSLLITLACTQAVCGQVPEELLQGKAVGLQLQPLTDLPRVVYVQPRAVNSEVAYFLDDKPVEEHFLLTLDPQEIAELTVHKAGPGVNGKTYRASISICTTPAASYRFISLPQLIDQYLTVVKDRPFLFLLDGEVIQQTPDDFHVNVAYLLKIELTEVPRGDGDTILNVVSLYTKSEANIQAMQQIRLRGMVHNAN